MANLWSRCPFCDAMKDKLEAILVIGQPILRAYKCGTYVYMADGVEVYSKACHNG